MRRSAVAESGANSRRATSGMRPSRAGGARERRASGLPAWSDVAIAVLLFGMAVAYFGLSFNRSFELSDQGIILYHSARVAAGEVPYRDFPDTYGPGVFLVTGALLRAFDGQILGVRTALVALKALAVALTYLICRFVLPRPFALLGAVVATAHWGRLAWNLNTPYAALYTIPLSLLACFAVVCALRVDSRRAYLVAGLIGGAPVVFKWTLGAFNAGGMVLAVLGVSALGTAPARRTRTATLQFLVPWALAAVAILAPGWRQLQPPDYVLHFLPLHAFMLAVGLAVARNGCGPVWPALRDRVGPLVAGLSVLPGLVALFYARTGALGALVFNVLTLPATIVNYYLPVPIPPLGRCLLLAGVAALVSAALLALRGRRGGAALAGAGALLALGGAAALHPHEALSTVLGPPQRSAADSRWLVVLWTVPAMVEGALPALVLLAAAALLAARTARGGDVPVRLVQVLVPLAMFQAALGFQVFPRGSFNVWLVHGAVAPLLAIVVHRWYRLGVSPTASRARRAAAAALVAVVPVWLVAPVVHNLFSSLALPTAMPLDLPQATGIVMSRLDKRMGRAGEMESLVRFLREAEPADAPVLPLSIDMMIMYLSGRPHAFPELDYYFFLLGLGMLPPAQCAQLASDALIERLERMPDTLIVIRRDDVSRRMLDVLPDLREAISRHYETVAKLGSYFVLRRRADGLGRGRPAGDGAGLLLSAASAPRR